MLVAAGELNGGPSGVAALGDFGDAETASASLRPETAAAAPGTSSADGQATALGVAAGVYVDKAHQTSAVRARYIARAVARADGELPLYSGVDPDEQATREANWVGAVSNVNERHVPRCGDRRARARARARGRGSLRFSRRSESERSSRARDARAAPLLALFFVPAGTTRSPTSTARTRSPRRARRARTARRCARGARARTG